MIRAGRWAELLDSFPKKAQEPIIKADIQHFFSFFSQIADKINLEINPLALIICF